MPNILAERPLVIPIAESADLADHPKKKRGPKPKVIVEFPEASGEEWVDPPSFPEALALHMRRHGDSCNHLHRAIIGPGDKTDRKTIQTWATGVKAPGTIESLSVLKRIERRYCLPEGYFQAKLDRTGRAAARPAIAALTLAERRKLAWHLPADFSKRPKREREEMLAWVRSVIIEGATEYRRFQRDTEAERLTRVRIGQDHFRRALLGYWNSRCPLTGISEPELLRASHIVPWAVCESDAERLDVHNGLLLAAHWDAAFDAGLVSFSESGQALFKPQLGAEALIALRHRDIADVPLTAEHQRYLCWHRRRYSFD